MTLPPLAHGGAVGLAVEAGAAVAVAAVLLWAAWKSRRDDDGNGERRP